MPLNAKHAKEGPFISRPAKLYRLFQILIGFERDPKLISSGYGWHAGLSCRKDE